MLTGLWPHRFRILAPEAWVNSLNEKGKFVTKIFFQIVLNKVLKSCKEMISADKKTDVKLQEIKELVAISFSKLEIQCKAVIYF